MSIKNHFSTDLALVAPNAFSLFKSWAGKYQQQLKSEVFIMNACPFWLQAGVMQGFFNEIAEDYPIRTPFAWPSYESPLKGELKKCFIALEGAMKQEGRGEAVQQEMFNNYNHTNG